MLVICNGMPRSASTWSFNVVRELLSDGGAQSFCGYDENLYRFFKSAPPETRDLILKCHSLDPMGLALVRSGAAKLIFTWRDPVDATASFMEMFEPDFERSLAIIKIALDLMSEHKKHGNGLLLKYDEIVQDGAQAVQRVATYLGLCTDRARAASIAEDMGLDKMRRRLEEIGSLDYGPKLVRHEYGLYDPITLLNVDHIRHGGTGYGRQKLSFAQIERIESLANECARRI